MKITPRVIWGKLVAVLRQRREMSLLVACGDIVDVETSGDNFLINVTDKAIYDVIAKQENIETLTKILQSMGHNYKLIINKKDKPEDLVQKDIDTLTKLVGDKLKIKG